MLHFKTVILKKISIFYDSIYFALEPKKKNDFSETSRGLWHLIKHG